MTLEEMICEGLEKTREQLVSVIASELAFQGRPFVVLVKERMPHWELIHWKGFRTRPPSNESF